MIQDELELKSCSFIVEITVFRGLVISGRFRQFYFLQKNADYENEKCLKIKVFICILHSKQKKDTLFLTSTRRYENLRKVSPFLVKSGTFLGFVFDIK